MEKSQAQEYSENSSMQKEDGLKLNRQLCPQEGMKVLDLGCGTGYLSNVLAERVGLGGKVVAVDPDKERLRIAKETYGAVSNILFQEGSTDEFPVDQYDIVFSNHVMAWVKDKETAFKNIYKNLKLGGSFGMQVGIQKAKLLDHINALMGPETVQLIEDRLVFAPCEIYEKIGLSCGLSLQLKLKTPTIIKYKNIEDLFDWWYGTTHGMFDTKLIDTATLEEFKKPFGDKALEIEIGVVATLIFVKPLSGHGH